MENVSHSLKLKALPMKQTGILGFIGLLFLSRLQFFLVHNRLCNLRGGELSTFENDVGPITELVNYLPNKGTEGQIWLTGMFNSRTRMVTASLSGKNMYVPSSFKIDL